MGSLNRKGLEAVNILFLYSVLETESQPLSRAVSQEFTVASVF